MQRREFLKFAGGATVLAAASPGMLLLEGCPSKNQVAALVQELGTSTAALVSQLGLTTLAGTITADTTAAVSAIQNWQNGSPATEAVEALNLLMTNLNAICSSIPNVACSTFEPLIDLALGTIVSIIAILAPSASVTAPKASVVGVALTNPPKNAGEFKKRWNAICDGNPALKKARR
jgi:hypothetical protein